jgi:DNA processing protein
MGVEDLLRKLGQPPLPPQPTPIPEDLTPLEVTVLAELGPEPLPLELLIQRTNFGTGDLTAILLLLELKGLVVQLPGLRYQRG